MCSARCCLVAASHNNYNNNFTDHRSRYNNNEKFEMLRELPKCDAEMRIEYMLLEKMAPIYWLGAGLLQILDL
jgi:hypothetical protein